MFLRAAAVARTAAARRGRPRARALREPPGHRRLGDPPAGRDPVQLHRARERPVRRARAARAQGRRRALRRRRSRTTTGALLLERCPDARVETIHCGVDGERHAWRGLRRTNARPGRLRGQPVAEEGPGRPARRRRAAGCAQAGGRARADRRRSRARAAGAAGARARGQRARGHARRPLVRRGGGGAGCGPRLRAAVDPAAERPDGGHPGRSDGGDGQRRAGRRDAPVGHPGARRGRRHGAARRAA